VTCRWWWQVGDDTRRLINEWIDQNHSIRQLHDILTEPSDDPDEPALDISITGFRLHLNHHDQKCRGDDRPG